MNSRDDLSGNDLRDLRIAYESVHWSAEEICDRFAFSPGGLRQFAHRRGWKRPELHYRCGVKRKEIPEARRETAQLLWETGENTQRIGRWIGTSENTAHALCTREFGARDVRQNRRTYFARRKEQMLAMREAGASIVEICDYFWLGRRRVRTLLDEARTSRSSIGDNVGDLSDHIKADARLAPTLERHERHDRALNAAVRLVSLSEAVREDHILWETRGRKPVAEARAVSMYVLHVEGRYSLTDTGFLIGRDRTNVAHACMRVEDRRDDPTFDAAMDVIARDFSIVVNGGIDARVQDVA